MEKDFFPFLTRNMLDFQHGFTPVLRIITHATSDVALTIRGMTKQGPFTLSHTPTNDSAGKVEDFQLPDIPIFVSVEPKAAGLVQGDTHATLYLMANGDLLHRLCAGYVYEHKAISWPFAGDSDFMPNRGKFAFVSGADPDAGNEAIITVPTNQIWRVLWGEITLVTDITATSRRVHIALGGASAATLQGFGDVDQTASLTKTYRFGAMGQPADREDSGSMLINIPADVVMLPGMTIDTLTTNLQAGDNFSRFDFYVEQFFQP